MAGSAQHTPEALLEKALHASDPVQRAKYASRGLRHPALELELQSLLLRQLYLAHLEKEQFGEARRVAEQMIALGHLPEAAHFDASRACVAAGDLDAAVGHLRLVARLAAPQRRAQQSWALGRVLYLSGQYDAACAAFERALRWATEHAVVYRAHRALACHHLEQSVDLREAYVGLSQLDPLPLYAEAVAVELLRLLGETKHARDVARTFLEQAVRAPLETRVGLRAEVGRIRTWFPEVAGQT